MFEKNAHLDLISRLNLLSESRIWNEVLSTMKITIFTTILFFTVVFTEYANRYYRRGFRKKHKSKIWELTEESILDTLSLVSRNLQKTQKVDELWHTNAYWIFKYDFRVALSKDSAKQSGNRCICYLDNNCNQIQILIMYAKTDLPKKLVNRHTLRACLKVSFVII